MKPTKSVIGGILLLSGILAGSGYIVHAYRRPGSMTPIEAQSMEMEMPAPAGTLPVELATAERGAVANTVRYTGQAVGYVEQDVTPRVTGLIVWMPYYAGDHVRRGQLLARLDTSQSAPLAASQRAALQFAEQGVGVARKEYEQTMAAIHEAHAEVGMKTGAMASARADLNAAREARAGAAAQLDAARSMTPDAAAQFEAAQADLRYWRTEIDRENRLYRAGAVTQEENQREQAQADNAAARVRQAEARRVQVEAQIRAAQAEVNKADAMVASAKSRVDEAQAELDSHFAHVGSTEAMAASAKQKIAQAQAGVEQARAMLSGAVATQAYSEIRAETDGVITQRVVSPGVLVTPGQTLLRVARITPIRLQANVAETDVQRIRVGSAVRVTGQTGDANPLLAHITSISPGIDPTARTATIETIVPNHNLRFLPGQFVAMEITTGVSAAGVRIPSRALRYHTIPSGDVITAQSTPTVWLAAPAPDQPGQFIARETIVRIGLTDGDYTAILDGVKPGDKVVLNGQDNLRDGDMLTESSSGQSAQPNDAPGTNGIAAMKPSAPARATANVRSSNVRSSNVRSSNVRSSNVGSSNVGSSENGVVKTGRHATSQPTAHLHYTCIMHPQIDLDHPGNCPICGMTLVPKRAGGRR